MCWADHLSQGVLPNVVCPSVILKPQKGGLGPWGLLNDGGCGGEGIYNNNNNSNNNNNIKRRFLQLTFLLLLPGIVVKLS